jgi:hypothetical protein
MAEAKKAAAVSTKDTAALAGAPVQTQHDATGRVTGEKVPEMDPNAPVKVKVVDAPTDDTPDDQRPYSTRLGHLSDEEQVATYGHVLKPEEPFVSEGMRHDLITYGYAVDPASGKRVELA